MNKLRLVLLMLIVTFNFSFNVFAADYTTVSPSSLVTNWTYCATEGGFCSFSGLKQVRYGANGFYVYKTFTNGTSCRNSVFGDPIVGTVKACYYADANDATPPTTVDNASTNWVNKNVTVTLTATDSDSGVNATYYTVDGGAQQTGTTINITADGTHTLMYWSVDKAGNVEAKHTATVRIDKTAPTVKVVLDKNTLWQPNHRLIPITASVSATGSLSGVNSIVLTSITSNESDNGFGDGDQANDIQGVELGTFDTSFMLRAERAGNGTGRVYTITYTVTDNAGNATNASATILVPHD